MPKIVPYLYKNGGNIIMIQVENQYGQFGCHADYLIWARDLTFKYVGKDVKLITNNLVQYAQIECTSLDNLATALDFMPGKCSLFYFSEVLNLKFNPTRTYSQFQKFPIFHLFLLTGTNQTIKGYFQTLRKYHPKGPILVTEFYTEWTPIWNQKKTNFISAPAITKSLR